MTVILTEIKDNVGIIKLNRPKALNAINGEMVAALEQILIEWQDSGLSCVILTGEGRAFAAGAVFACELA